MKKIEGTAGHAHYNPERIRGKKVSIRLSTENSDNAADSVHVSEAAKKKHVMGHLMSAFANDAKDSKPPKA